MKILFSGDTAKFPIEIYSDGVRVSPANVDLLKWVRVIVYSRVDAANVVNRYCYGIVPPSGWVPLVFSATDDTLYLILTAVDTAKIINEELVMQITTCIHDPLMPNQDDISTGTAVFCKIKLKED